MLHDLITSHWAPPLNGTGHQASSTWTFGGSNYTQPTAPHQRNCLATEFDSMFPSVTRTGVTIDGGEVCVSICFYHELN
jgi:hypothetical protein